MNEVKTLRLAAGLTQRELSLATAIFPLDVIANAELGGALTTTQWWAVQYVCNDRIKVFTRDAGMSEGEKLIDEQNAPSQRTWSELTDSEIDEVSCSYTESEGFRQGALWAAEKLKDKNHASKIQRH